MTTTKYLLNWGTCTIVVVCFTSLVSSFQHANSLLSSWRLRGVMSTVLLPNGFVPVIHARHQPSTAFPVGHRSLFGTKSWDKHPSMKMKVDNSHPSTAVSAATTTSVTTSVEDQRTLWVTYLNLILYACSYQLQLPVEPFLIKSLSAGASAATVSQTYGRLLSFFSVIQTIGSPLVGILLDRVGIRHASAIVFLSSALSYFILANATDLNLLFWSKVPTALQAAFLVAQATAAASTGGNDAARAQALGRMTTAYTVGATIGPALGGYLAKMGDLYLGAKLAVAGSLLSVVLSLLFLPNIAKPATTSESPDSIEDAKSKNPKGTGLVQGLQNAASMALRANLWPLLVVKVVGGMAASMYQTALPLVLTQQLNFDPSQLGVLMSSSMFAVAAFGAFAMAPLVNVVGPPNMVRLGLLSRTVLQALLATIVTSAVTNDRTIVAWVTAVSVMYSLCSHTLATGLTTQTTGAVEKHEQGTLLGVEHSLFSLARIGSPPLATTLLLSGFWTVVMTCGTLDVLLVAGLIVLANAGQQDAYKKNKWP